MAASRVGRGSSPRPTVGREWDSRGTLYALTERRAPLIPEAPELATLCAPSESKAAIIDLSQLARRLG